MDISELSNYQFQLEQVQTSLETNPNNAELQKLKADLKDLMSLTRQMNGLPPEEEEESSVSAKQVNNEHEF